MADEHQEIGELLSRHATLQATNGDLRAHKARCDEAAEALRSELAAYAKRCGDELLLLSNRWAPALWPWLSHSDWKPDGRARSSFATVGRGFIIAFAGNASPAACKAAGKHAQPAAAPGDI